MHLVASQRRDRRRHRRYDVRGVRGTLVLPLQVKVLNMSLTGLAVESRQALEISRKYDLELRDGRQAIPLNADVQWCHLVRTERQGSEDVSSGDVSPVYQAGLDFRHVLSDHARELLGFLEHNVVIDMERRVFGRFTIDRRSSVALGAHHEFLIRKLSFSGMLIETDLLPEVGAAFEMEVLPGKERLRTRGRVVHAERLPRDSGCRAGIEFVQMPAATRQSLEQMIGGLLE